MSDNVETGTKYKMPWRYRLRSVLASVCEWIIDAALHVHPSSNGPIADYAEQELLMSGWYDEDAFYDDLVPKAVLRSVRMFELEGHSGMSAGLVSGITADVVMFKPLSPLKGSEDEWCDGDGVQQNKRFSAIFRENGANATAHWISGKVFREPSGVTYTSGDSSVPVKFPWTYREPEIVDVDESA